MEQEKKIKKIGGIQTRMGFKFHREMEKIQLGRIKNGKTKEKTSIEKITNMIVRHTEAWGKISNDIINAEEEEVRKYGM